jgi:hypothetical protein
VKNCPNFEGVNKCKYIKKSFWPKWSFVKSIPDLADQHLLLCLEEVDAYGVDHRVGESAEVLELEVDVVVVQRKPKVGKGRFLI